MDYIDTPFAMAGYFHHIIGIIIFIFLISAIGSIIWKSFHYINTKSKCKEQRNKGKNINKKVLANYHKEGLNDHDIDYFREMMATALKQINQIESISSKNKTLKSINKELNLEHLLHGFFKAIVAKPNRIDAASNFLFKELPSLTTIYQKYSEIDSYLYKDQDTEKVLNLSKEAIEKAYHKINEEYHKFISDDLQTLHDAADNFQE
ncbi:5-bromo-4-chloroindolyl phosphate hydrolysis family protein [Xylocopilactobacillus apis]|uniref:5-bromo-4-chloroindolyl phosphate hydrolysis protein n=1 Tax=Xylocopilactobacillus apis TaxID=2932183 RepID=A0AAU9DR86_9LACO|nr:5-bromo-4-chloroindolyl phosphate hydrolysis family protein [Xylocopilactobacillus apis]BDR56148.1 hypothetical protein KIMC2_07100 [Xylocopilactobacillus apis]